MAEPHATAPASRWTGWLNAPWAIPLLVVLSALPLLWPDMPPLTDLSGHVGRYFVQLHLADHPALQAWYRFDWTIVGNLGVDLLIEPVSRLFGLELGVKLIVMTIPMITTAAMLLIARHAHGTIPPTALFALPLAYGFPFQFGFVNFSLAMAFCLLAFWLWLKLQGRAGLRTAVFLILPPFIWITHIYGWAVLCILCFGAELARVHGEGRSLIQTVWMAGLRCLPLALPFALMLFFQDQQAAAATGDWFNIQGKIMWLSMVLNDRWLLFDLAGVVLLLVLIFHGARSPGLVQNRQLATAAVLMLIVYVLMPRVVLGSAYADMRLVPVMLAIAILALRPATGIDARHLAALGLAGLAFFGLRTGGMVASFLLYDRGYDRALAALDHVPKGARLVSFVGKECRDNWTPHRLDHVPGFAIVRRQAFSNEQWTLAGGQLLTVHYPAAGYFQTDPSQFIVDDGCDRPETLPISRALTDFPRTAFDYVWLLAAPSDAAAKIPDLERVWQDGPHALYRVKRPALTPSAGDRPVSTTGR